MVKNKTPSKMSEEEESLDYGKHADSFGQHITDKWETKYTILAPVKAVSAMVVLWLVSWLLQCGDVELNPGPKASFFDPVKVSKFLETLPSSTPEEILAEYFSFLRSLDVNLLKNEKRDIIKKVKSELGIELILKNYDKLDL